MDSQTATMRQARTLVRLALWTAVGVVLGGLERLIPQPIPWAKLGIANLAAIIVLYGYGWRSALLVNVARVLTVALFLGSWATPVFVLSLGGAIVSVPAMAFVRSVGGRHVSVIGVSAVGAFVHMLTQFGIASILIAQHGGLFIFAGPSLLAAIISGVLMGLLASFLLNRLPDALIQQ
ncbi:heptaprenyl diphosphate synthase component I [bacterium BMS3Bbin04]|nr:heptaprenyl diphosphate synthase component I [bacterium BMS3Bbin04]